MCSMLRSISSRWTGRFCSAFKKPLRSLLTSNGSRRSSRLTTYGMTSSGISKVVNRSPHERHSRRRRTCLPSPARRESVTFVSSKLQNGQCTLFYLPLCQASRSDEAASRVLAEARRKTVPGARLGKDPRRSHPNDGHLLIFSHKTGFLCGQLFDDARPSRREILAVVAAAAHRKHSAIRVTVGEHAEPPRGVRVRLGRELQVRDGVARERI